MPEIAELKKKTNKPKRPYVTALFSLLFQMSGATLFNLSILTSDMWVVVVRILFYHQEDLRNHQAEQDKPLSLIYKEVETTPAYPDICFAVDDFDSTFDVVVRRFFYCLCCGH